MEDLIGVIEEKLVEKEEMKELLSFFFPSSVQCFWNRRYRQLPRELQEWIRVPSSLSSFFWREVIPMSNEIS